ncbi:MAG: hypoxanthine phosphoribosyltransferase [Verrucomicrobiales bacterium]|jgi:hypoxanthine phosphoribosyltransferase|nr:hypoxanthine phosphoribosyltransferase [Verrucomicrobiales bacterium]
MPLPGKPLISAPRIQKRVRELARSIASHYQGKPLTVVGLMNGGLFFMVDVTRRLPPDTRIECWKVGSYHGKKSTNRVIGLDGCEGDYHGRHVLLLDDILDTGRTLSETREKLLQTGAVSVKTCVLLSKNAPRVRAVSADWVGFKIENHYVIGYGLDYRHRYRTLPMIRRLD